MLNMKPNEIKQEIEKLPLSEKLTLIEEVWDAIAISNDQLPFSEWQKTELKTRYTEYQNNNLELHDWESVHSQIKKNR